MNTPRRVIVAASACLLTAAAPALAQVAPANTTGNSAAPAQNGVVGNAQLQGFSLNGTTTRKAPEPTPLPARPSATQPRPQAQATPKQRQATPDAPNPRREPPPNPSAGMSAAPPAENAPALDSGVSSTAPALTPAPVPAAPADSRVAAPSSPISFLPWIIAALALAGAAAWFFLRQRPRESLAGASERFDVSPAPAAAPRPNAAPAAAPASAPPQPAPSGIVSTRLRPWLEIEFKPDRGVVDEQKAAIAFEVSVYNSGSMPARDVLLEASLFNAGPMQDQQIQLFFDNPVARGDKIPVIPPMKRITVNTAVFLAKDQVVPIEMEGRELFVPMVAFNALYSWGSGKGQTSASYLVGKETAGDKLAPFRLDLGPRIFRGLAARVHSIALRK